MEYDEMKEQRHVIVVPEKTEKKNTQLPSVDLDAITNPSLTLCKIRDLFRQVTGLDLFLFFQNQSMGKWKEEPFSQKIELPRYCRIIREHPIGLARCISSHQTMQAKALDCKRPVCQRCHAGLTTIHFPLSLSGKGKADLQTVCALPHGERSDASRSLIRKISDLELPEKDLRKAVDELRIVSKSKANQVIDWLELITNYLTESSNHLQSRDSSNRYTSQANECPLVENRIRVEIGRQISLPSWRAQRSTGASAALMEQVISFVDQHYGMMLSTQIIAQALGFEPSYFAKIFRQNTKESLTAYIKRVRLQRAKKLLKDPYLSILEVAQRTGFNDASYFTRVFHSAFGITPTEFREISKDDL